MNDERKNAKKGKAAQLTLNYCCRIILHEIVKATKLRLKYFAQT